MQNINATAATTSTAIDGEPSAEDVRAVYESLLKKADSGQLTTEQVERYKSPRMMLETQKLIYDTMNSLAATMTNTIRLTNRLNEVENKLNYVIALLHDMSSEQAPLEGAGVQQH